MESQQIQIHKDMTIAEILQADPAKTRELAEIMTAAGLHCVGCGASTFETLEQGLAVHGYTEEQLQSLIKQLNEALAAPVKQVSAEQEQQAASVTPVSFTEKGLAKVKDIMKGEGKEGWGLRVGVMPGGCAGYSYELAFEEKERDTDKVLDQEGVKLFVDPDSYQKLDGVIVDFVDNLNESGFKFENPNAKGGCGCGKSFN